MRGRTRPPISPTPVTGVFLRRDRSERRGEEGGERGERMNEKPSGRRGEEGGERGERMNEKPRGRRGKVDKRILTSHLFINLQENLP